MTKYKFSERSPVHNSVNLSAIAWDRENLVDYLPNYLSQLTEYVNFNQHDIYFSSAI